MRGKKENIPINWYKISKAIETISKDIQNTKFIIRRKTKRYWKIGRKITKHAIINLINQDEESRMDENQNRT